MRNVTLAATQTACGWDRDANVATAERLVRHAASEGAQIVLLQELFETPYFCQDQKQEFFALASPVEDHPVLRRMSALAAELQVVLPVSFFERANNAYYNSLAMIDADGRNLGIYRKSHIPDGPGYQEKYYFNPGDTGFQVFKTRYARVGAAICWDQWFPESARCMALQGAEVLFYPTAIGSEPQDAGLDSRDHWQRVMQGHAGANLMPLVASNRIGVERVRELGHHVLRFILHRGTSRGKGGRSRAGQGSRADCHFRSGQVARRARVVGPFPRPPAGTLSFDPDTRRQPFRKWLTETYLIRVVPVGFQAGRAGGGQAARRTNR